MSTINVKEAAMKQAEENGGKLAVVSKVTIDSKEDLSIAYTPGSQLFHRRLRKTKNSPTP